MKVGEDAISKAPTVNTRIKCDDNDVFIPLPPGSDGISSLFFSSKSTNNGGEVLAGTLWDDNGYGWNVRGGGMSGCELSTAPTVDWSSQRSRSPCGIHPLIQSRRFWGIGQEGQAG
jgi:hypothetical protein